VRAERLSPVVLGPYRPLRQPLYEALFGDCENWLKLERPLFTLHIRTIRRRSSLTAYAYACLQPPANYDCTRVDGADASYATTDS